MVAYGNFFGGVSPELNLNSSYQAKFLVLIVSKYLSGIVLKRKQAKMLVCKYV